MDLITQALLGATIAQVGWRDSLGAPAVWCGALFGMVPDLDLLSAACGPWAELTHHRGFTHSLLFAPLVAPVFGLLTFKLLGERGRARDWSHLIFWALLTHPLLDVFTTYGTQPFHPISRHRFALDGISIVDPIYTLPLIAALVFGHAQPKHARALASAALLMTTLYLGFGYQQAARARAFTLAELARQDLHATHVRATPTPGNVWLWRVLARDDARGTLHVGHHSHAQPEPITFETLSWPQRHSALEIVQTSERGRLYTWFAMDWVSYEVERQPDATTLIRIQDQRYGYAAEPTQTYWGAEAHVSSAGEILSFRRVQNARGDLQREVRALWHKLWHGGSTTPER